MPTITVLAPDSSLAMDEVIRQLGDNAYILATNARNGQVEILATNEPTQTQVTRKRAATVSFSDLMAEQVAQGGGGASILKAERGIPVMVQGPAPRAGSNIVAMKHARSASNNMASIAAMARQDPVTSPSELMAHTKAGEGLHPLLQDISKRLYELEAMTAAQELANDKVHAGAKAFDPFTAIGFSDAIVASMAPDTDKLDRAIQFSKKLANALIAPEPLAQLRKRAVVIAGASGVGKTMLAAKIASLSLETHVGRQIELVSVSETPKVTETPLSNYAQTLSVRHHALQPDQFDVGQFEAQDTTYILDTNLEPEVLDKTLGALVAHIGSTEIAMVVALSAGSSVARISAELQKYRNLDPVVALTKLDECELSPHEASQIAETGSKIAFLSAGASALTDAILPVTEEIICEFLCELLSDGR